MQISKSDLKVLPVTAGFVILPAHMSGREQTNLVVNSGADSSLVVSVDSNGERWTVALTDVEAHAVYKALKSHKSFNY